MSVVALDSEEQRHVWKVIVMKSSLLPGNLFAVFKGGVSWVFFISFVKSDEIRPSISCQI